MSSLSHPPNPLSGSHSPSRVPGLMNPTIVVAVWVRRVKIHSHHSERGALSPTMMSLTAPLDPVDGSYDEVLCTPQSGKDDVLDPVEDPNDDVLNTP